MPAFPAHYAPVDLQFFTGATLPAKLPRRRLRGDARLVEPRAGADGRATTSSTSRSPTGKPSGKYEVFADGFNGKTPLMSPDRRRGAPQRHRPRARRLALHHRERQGQDLARVLPRLGAAAITQGSVTTSSVDGALTPQAPIAATRK